MELGTYKFTKQPNQYTTRLQRFVAKMRWYIRKALQLSVVGSVGIIIFYVVFMVGQWSAPAHLLASPEEPIYAVLDRIYQCESGGKHYDKNGQVLMRSNVNKTVDVGIGQINSVWFAKATELGLDITKEEDNKKMSEWIYFNKGTGDWSSSAKCWQK